MSSARLTNPDAIRDFRMHMVSFKEVCESALSGSASELSRVRDWLRIDQLSHWKKQLIKREELYQTARRMWLEAEGDTVGAMNKRGPAKPSSMEERIVMDRARRHRDEAEEKLALVRRWMLKIEQDGEPLVNQCQSHDFALREECTKAIVQLDRLFDQVHEYLAVPTAELRSTAMPASEALPPATSAAAGPAIAPLHSTDTPPADAAPAGSPAPEAHHA
jgi:hypothetical protein